MAETFFGEKIGKLGFGFMRLPRSGGRFDFGLINRMVDAFLKSGFNYFDTAYVYEGSEEAMRKSLVCRHPREKYVMATKLPVMAASSAGDIEKFFNTSLSRLGADYVDFYLLHTLNAKLNEKAEEFGAWEFVAKMKDEGKVRHYGFSFHGAPEDLEAILDRHPEAEFVQLQINYLDWDSKDVQSRRLYEIARSRSKPIIIMEPVKGGMLAGQTVSDILKKANPAASPASWAIRFSASLEGVMTVLSGMNTMEQLSDNVATVKNLLPFTEEERRVLNEAVEALRSSNRVPCTGCRYCVENCPQKINIPMMMNLYSDYLVYKTTANIADLYAMFTRGGGKASSCVACRSCEEHCPQRIEISDIMGKLAAVLG